MFFRTYNDYCKAEIPADSELTILESVNTLVVHGGAFHTDDVLAAVLMRIYDRNIHIFRESDSDRIADYLRDPTVLVADIGFGDFDHHQLNAPFNRYGIKHAACGRLYEALKKDIPLTAVQRANLEFVMPHIENTDNNGSRQFGKVYNNLSSTINSLRPTFLEVEESESSEQELMNKHFGSAMKLLRDTLFAAKHRIRIPSKEQSVKLTDLIAGNSSRIKKVFDELFETRALEAERADEAAAVRLADAYKNTPHKEILLLDKWFPTYTALQEPKYDDLRFSVFPSLRGGYLLNCLHTSERSAYRLQFPSRWLEKKPEGCTFVHQSLFTASFVSREAAIRAGMVMCVMEEDALRRVRAVPESVLDMPFHSDKAIITALEMKPELIKEISSPTKEMCRTAIIADPSLLKDIRKPSLELRELAAERTKKLRSAGRKLIGAEAR